MAKTMMSSMGDLEPQDRLRSLTKLGNIIEVDPSMPVRRYHRCGTEMLRMAHVYLKEGDHENAFILYLKYMTLFIEKIRQHPDYAQIRTEMKAINKAIKEDVMPTSEKLRGKLLERYQKEYDQFRIAKEAEKARELERERQQQARAAAAAAAASQKSNNNSANNILASQLHVQIDPKSQPSAPDLSMLDRVMYPNDFPTGTNRSQGGLLLPAENDLSKASAGNKPAFDRSQKPPLYERSDSLLAGGLRTVFIPQNTMDAFLKLADRNTAKNVETCGILAGHLAHSKLFITHIIIPKQHGTPDSCNTSNEEEIFDVQDRENLITLGWIHTHPTQTAFLSSVDLHTHCSYQMMMPEAIAIVCAPKYQSTGFFILTPHYGLNFIAQCHQTGFHPHPNDPPLFMDAQHIQMDGTSRISVVDLRR